MNIQEFLKGTPKVPRLLVADAYTIGSGPHIADAAKQGSIYNITARRWLKTYLSFASDNRLIFVGLRRILRDLFTRPVTTEEIEETAAFLKTSHAGGVQFHWDREVWDRLVRENNGIPPLKIEAMLEGTTFFPYEPVIQIVADNGYGELAGYFESKLLQVWSTIERATTLRWWWEYLRQECRRMHPSWSDQRVDLSTSIMCHDFGDRASSCSMESEILGMTHNLVLPGTDTFSGAYLDWKDTGEPYGCSIHALAHRTVMSFVKESDAHIALYHLGRQTGITAHVSDTYDYFTTVERLANKLANDPEWKNDSNLMTCRPDSGNAVECVLHVCKMAEKYGLYTIEDGLKVATRMRWIQGDSMSWDSMQHILAAVKNSGFSPFGFGCFGVGGHLRNTIARDHSALSMKLAAVADGDAWRPTCKRSETTAKTSIPGAVIILDNEQQDLPTVYAGDVIRVSKRPSLLRVWYDGRRADRLEDAFKEPCLETNTVIRERIQKRFLDRVQPTQVLSEEIRELRDKVLSTQKTNAW